MITPGLAWITVVAPLGGARRLLCAAFSAGAIGNWAENRKKTDAERFSSNFFDESHLRRASMRNFT
jgi:hypothetical protein